MVTTQEARQQLLEARGQATQREQQISEFERQARQQRTFAGTISGQFATGGRVEQFRRGIIEQERAIVPKARTELGLFRQTLSERETEIGRVEAAQAERKAIEEQIRQEQVARKFATSGKFDIGASKRVRRIAGRVLRREIIPGEKRIEQIKGIKSLGFDPIFEKGKLIGFESLGKESRFVPFTSTGLSGLGKGTITGLEELGLVETVPPSTVFKTTTTRQDVIAPTKGKPSFIDKALVSSVFSFPGAQPVTDVLTGKLFRRKQKEPFDAKFTTQDLLRAVETGSDIGTSGQTFIPITPEEEARLPPGTGKPSDVIFGGKPTPSQPLFPTPTTPTTISPSLSSLEILGFKPFPKFKGEVDIFGGVQPGITPKLSSFTQTFIKKTGATSKVDLLLGRTPVGGGLALASTLLETPPGKRVVGGVKELLFSEERAQIIGLPGFIPESVQETFVKKPFKEAFGFEFPDITARDVKGVLQRGISPRRQEQFSQLLTGITPSDIIPRTRQRRLDLSRTKVKGVSLGGEILGTDILFPTTPGGIALVTVTPKGFSLLTKAAPKVARGVKGLIGVSGIPTILDPALPIQERVGGGVVSVLGFGGAVFQPTKFQLGIKGQKAQVSALLEKDVITSETARSLLSGIKLQKFFKGQKDIPIRKGISDILPSELSLEQRIVAERFLLEKKPLLFGGKRLELSDIRPSKDIDVALKQEVKAIKELGVELQKVSRPGAVKVKGQKLILEGKGLFDVKDLPRLQDFPLAQRPVKTTEGVPTTRISEQFSRSISGTIGFGGEVFRRGGKDFPDVLLVGKALLGEASTRLEGTKIPGVRILRQLRLSRAEKKFLELQKATGEVERLTGLDVTVDPFRRTTATPGLQDIAKEIESSFPKGKKARIGGLTLQDITRPPRRVKVKPGRLRRATFESEFGVSKFKPLRVTAPSLFFPKGFKPSEFVPPSVRGQPPSVFRPQVTGRPTPEIIPRPTPRPIPSEFRPPPVTSRTPPPPTLLTGGLPGLPSFRARKREKVRIPRKKQRRIKRPKRLPQFADIGKFQPSFVGTFLKSRGLKIRPGRGQLAPTQFLPVSRQLPLPLRRKRPVLRRKKKRR